MEEMVIEHSGQQPGEADGSVLSQPATPDEPRSRGCILLVTTRHSPTPTGMGYVVNLADRLGSKIIMVSVNPRPFSVSAATAARRQSQDTATEIDTFRHRAQARGIDFEYIEEEGKISKIVNRLCHIVRRVEFVVIDQGIEMEEVAAGSSVPVFGVHGSTGEPMRPARSHQKRTFFQGESSMKTVTRKAYIAKSFIFGVMTAALYSVVFAYSKEIMHYWTMGGVYCLLPVATVFVFSYAHGSFTGNFWSALGIEGSKASSLQQKSSRTTASKTSRKRPDTRPRLEVRA
ncbi:MAG: hypothetical protein ACK5PS_02845 [Desulfopila sp.]